MTAAAQTDPDDAASPLPWLLLLPTEVAAVDALTAEPEVFDLVLVIVAVRVTFLVTVSTAMLVVVSPVVAAAALTSPISEVAAGAEAAALVTVTVKVRVSLIVNVLTTWAVPVPWV